jgi:cell division protein FtsI (penicillin-binding protein 3)
MISQPERKRLTIAILIMISLSLLILLRYAWLMLKPAALPDPVYKSASHVERGSLHDRNERLLAIQTQLFSVSAWLPQVSEPEETAALLSPILGINQTSLTAALTDSSGGNFLYLKRKASITEADAINLLMEKKKLRGITLSPEPGRNYPERNLVSHLVGYVGTDNIGLDGIEYTFNHVLAPASALEGPNPVHGNRISLTIDLNTQFMVRKIAEKAFLENNPESIMILVMDARTGEILSWVSLPDYDPNTYQKYDQSSRMNRPAVFTYEPGSVFKIFTIASLFDLGVISPDQLFDTSAGYDPEIFKKYGITRITDVVNYGVIRADEILVHSSNVASAMASENTTAPILYGKLRDFGFGKRTGVPLPGESSGILMPPEKWSIRTKPTITLGQELGVSAVQVISAATVFTNGGILLKPQIIKRITAPDGSILKEYGREPLHQVISAETAEAVLLMMEQGVSREDGTAKRARVPGLRVSAKTGTAQVADPVTGHYSSDKYVASTLGIFPTENPKLIVYVVFETPKGDSYYGGRIAAPVLKEVVTALAPYYNIPVAGNTLMNHSGQVRLSVREPLPDGKAIPDFSGYSKREVLIWFERNKIPFEVEGEGWVTAQSPPPGTEITRQTKIKLVFR